MSFIQAEEAPAFVEEGAAAVTRRNPAGGLDHLLGPLEGKTLTLLAEPRTGARE
jgi:hypothetical protein